MPSPGSPSEARAKNIAVPPIRGADGPEAAHLGHVTGVDAVLQGADEDEERAGGEGVADDLQHHALQGQRVPGEDAEQHEAHVAHAGVRDEPFQVGLRVGHHGAVDDADHGEDHADGAEVVRRPAGRAAP